MKTYPSRRVVVVFVVIGGEDVAPQDSAMSIEHLWDIPEGDLHAMADEVCPMRNEGDNT